MQIFRRWSGAMMVALALGLAGCEQGGSDGDLFLPPAGFVADPDKGRALFQAHCSGCHGPDARGSRQGPPLIHQIYEPSHHSDLAFFRAVHRGSHQHHWQFGPMPPVEGVDAASVGHIVAYIRREQRAAGIR